MKTKYQQPEIQVIELYGKYTVMLQMSGTKVDTSADGFTQRSNKKNLDIWSNECEWK